MKKGDRVKYKTPIAGLGEGKVKCEPYEAMDTKVVDVLWDGKKVKSELIPIKLLEVVT